MVDAHALGACGCARAGSNPASPTRLTTNQYVFYRRAPTFLITALFCLNTPVTPNL